MTLFCAVQEATKQLEENNIENAAYDSFALLEAVTKKDRTYYLLHRDEELSKDEYKKYCEYIQRRKSHEPLQHILGKTWFYGYEFIVNSNVLVPRPDTEILVEEAKKISSKEDVLIDMCTGSGCIILTLAKENCFAKGVGVDISDKALEVAKANRKQLEVSEKQVAFIQSDMFTNVSLEEKADVIVSNPPYIKTAVINELSEEVRLHDPMLALDGQADGLYFYREITKHAPQFLKSGGYLLYEIGHDQSEEVENIMSEYGFVDICTVKDLAGLDRVVKGRLR